MALLTFPLSPNNGDLFPINPLPGQTQYQWSSTDQTWTIVGTSTGVTAGTYGDAYNVGQFTVDAAGRITFAQDVPIATLITPAGADEEIQFNNNGVFGASANLTWDGVELYANNIETKFLSISDSRNAPNGSFIFGTTGSGFGQSYIYNFYQNRAFDIITTGTSPISFRNGSSGTPLMARLLPGAAAELYHNGSKKFETTSTGVSASGDVKATAGQLQVSSAAQPTFVTGFQAPASFTQSVVYRLPPADGSAGNVLSTNGSGTLSWVPASAATAGGSNTQIQFNSSGTLAGSSGLTWNGSTLSATGISATSALCLNLSGLYIESATDPFGAGRTFRLAGGSGTLSITTPGTVTDYTISLPDTQGAAGTVLVNDGAGNLGWLAAAKVVAVPGSQGAPGNPGEVAADSSYFYWYDGTNWQRVAAGPGGW